jgi:KaiC/GvpD/RAD55 family RecA-like ATPase
VLRDGVVDAVTKHRVQSIEDTARITYTSSPTDMTELGIAFSEFIESYYAARGIEKNRVLLDSLTTLLLYSNLQTVFRFVHVFTSRVENADALGLYTIESTAHDDETTSTLRQLFDGVVEVDHDGTLTFRLPSAEPTRIER